MLHCDLSQKEQHRRKEIAEHTRQMLLTELPIDSQDETSIMGRYRDYYLQISFSELHPLMVVCLAKALTHPGTAKQCRIANDLNLRSVLGSHAINDEVGCYSYRATHWLDTELNGLKAAGWYWFNADGTMFLEGIREENGTKYYYKDGVKNYAGLIEISGEYYYVKSDCSVVCDRSYYVTKSNGLMPSATYDLPV